MNLSFEGQEDTEQNIYWQNFFKLPSELDLEENKTKLILTGQALESNNKIVYN